MLFLEEIQSDWHQQGRKSGYGGQVPNAPLKGTDEWAMLAFKRMVRWAAENGFDRIAWTTGEQQAERFDLSKQVKEINAFKHGDTYYLTGTDLDGATISELDNRAFTANELPDVVGKELAERIVKDGGGIYSGDKLKVGGEGMQGFYDNILPKAVGKWAKKFGGKVGKTTLAAPKPGSSHNGVVIDPFATPDLTLAVHSIDLTPAMQEAAMGGLPVFSRVNDADVDALVRDFAGKDGAPTEAEIRAARKEWRETERTYGGRAAYDKAKKAGKTKLTYGQWVTVRTPRFKQWFGDWEAVHHRNFLDGKPVATLTGSEFAPDGVPLTTKVPQWYAQNGHSTVEVDGIGQVLLDEKAVKNSISHGIGRDKVAAFAAVPDVLRNGRVIHQEHMDGSVGGTVFHVAAPISMGGRDYVADVFVRSDANASRMYVHEVVLKEKLQQESAFKTSAVAAEAGKRSGADSAGAIRSVLQDIYGVNPDTVSKVVDQETGEPMVVYHGTDANFSEFSKEKQHPGQYGGKGFFFTGNAEVASRFGNAVMPVFLSAKMGLQEKRAARKRGEDVAVDHIRAEPDARDIWIVFEPNQIKSATANIGTFNESDNIMFSRATIRQPMNIDRAIIASRLGRGTSHQDYAAAKAGDREAGLRIAQMLVDDGLVNKVRDALAGKKPMIVPVVSVEATGRNKIPRAAAEVLAQRLGLETAEGITQANTPKRTALDGLDRIFAVPEFTGDVVAGQDYLLLDDTLTQGGTFAALASHIEAQGGRVVGAVALTGKRYSAKLALSSETLAALRDKHGDLESDFRAATGYGFDALTESEARYLANFKPAESVRDRILAERGRRRQGMADGAAGQTQGSVNETDQPAPPSAGQDRSGVLFSRPDDGQRFANATKRHANDVIDEISAELKAINAAAEGNGGSAMTRLKQWMKDATPAKLKERMRGTWLGALTTRHLTTLGSDYFKEMPIFTDLLASMNADRNMMQEEAESVAESAREWAGKHREEAQTLFDLMHDATLSGVDPAEDYQPLKFHMANKVLEVNNKNVKEALEMLREQMRGRPGDDKRPMLEEAKMLRAMRSAEPRRRAKYPALVARWNQLSPQAQDHYRAMRDLYKKRHDQTEAALIQKINDMKMENAGRKKILVNMIRRQFEQNRLQGVYFPLQRFGQYFVSAEKNGVSTFLMYETQPELDRAVKELRANGYSITAQGLKAAGKAKDAPSGTFVADVLEHLQKSGVNEKTRDDIYQMYLQAMPEMSMRKHKVHRKGVPGWDRDALRAFAFNQFHMSHQLSKLKYGYQLQGTLDMLEAQQNDKRRNGDADTKQIIAGDAILEELRKRYEWISNPQDSQLTNLISSFGFTYYLGITPAAAMVNLTQVPLLALPWLGTRFGAVKSMNHLLSALRDTIRTGGHIQKVLATDEERDAHRALQVAGALDKTQAHNIAGIAEGGMAGYNPKWAKAMEFVGKPFHISEVINREATGMAAFRLARADGMSFDEAVKFAADTIHETMFDYSNSNRARFMQSGAAKVLLMFRQYSLNLTWHIARMTWQATSAADPDVKKLARRNLAGVLGMSALFSGAMGLPMMGVVTGILNAVAASFGDDDEPWDAETEFRAFLISMLGRGGADTVLNGVVDQITGASISSRVSYSDLWFRDTDRELDGRGQYYNLLEQAAGPMGGVLKNVLVGKQLIDEGNAWRGVETMMPKALKDTMKGIRFASEGVNTLRGDPIIEDASVLDVVMQGIGFMPSKVREQYDVTRAAKNYEQHVIDRRARLLDAFAMSIRNGDEDGRVAVMGKIRQFNQAWPGIAITPSSIRSSIKSRARYSAQAENGIFLNRKIAARVKESVGVE